MPGGYELAIMVMISLASIAVPLAILVLIVKSISGGKRNAGLHQDEARIMQEIYQGLSRMEERLEALETLVLDPKDRVRTDK